MARREAWSIRPASVADLAAVVRIENLCFSDPWTPSSLLGELTADARRLPLVAEAPEGLVGYLMAWCVVDQLHVLNIATDPAWLRRGVGTSLLREAAQRARTSGLRTATLEVRRGNRAARAFYAAHGFRETGVRESYYADNGEDAVIMECDLVDLGEP